MDAVTDKWSRIKLLFDEALQQNRESRAAFLAQNCSEEDLRDLVEKLLVCHEEASGFLASSFPARAAALAINVHPTFSENDVLAERFKVVRLIARGGMGEVYEAEDLELRSPVAIKIIRPDILEKPRSLERFKREVHLAKQVTHPNICRVFDLFRHHSPGNAGLRDSDTYFVSMELLRGETLAEHLHRNGKMTTGGALPLVVQMAAALGAAHQMGILHRDFKPGNVVLVPSKTQKDFRVVVTDFGLASKSDSDLSASLNLTTQNEILGTLAYMSPEQMEGRELTPATDIYALGLVIYEMVTGTPGLEARTPIAALKRLAEPLLSPKSIVPDLEQTWEAAILKCVAHEPAERFQEPEQIVEALRKAEAPLAARESGQRINWLLTRNGPSRRQLPSKLRSSLSTRRHARIGFIAGAILSVAVLATFGFALRRPPELRWDSSRSSELTSDGRDKWASLLTDGLRLYFVEGRPGPLQLASVAVEGGAPGTLPFPLDDTTVVLDLSPAHSEILASGPLSKGGVDDLWLIPLFGGSPRRLGIPGVGTARFSPDKKRIAYICGHDLVIMNADGTQPKKIATVPSPAEWLRWSPDGKRFRFSHSEYLNGIAQVSLWEVANDGTNLHELLVDWHNPPSECCGSWTPDGSFYVFQSRQNGHWDLWALPERRTIFGHRILPPVQITSGLLDFSAPLISGDGQRIFALGRKQRGELVRYNAASHEFAEFLGGISATWVTFSKTGRWVAYLDYPSNTLWRASADGSEKKQITFSPFEVDGFSWSPDETQFAIRGRERNRNWRIYLVPASGGTPGPLMPGNVEQGVPTWEPDGTRLCFGDVPSSHGRPVGTERIHVFDLRTHGFSELPRSQSLWTSRWSPDGRYISALTIQGGRLMLFDVKKNSWHSTSAVQVNNPNWSSDGKYIYYDTEGHDRVLRRVRIENGEVDQLVSLADYPSLTGAWSGLAPDNSPLLLRDLGYAEIYSLPVESR